jgi:DNA polymerase-4
MDTLKTVHARNDVDELSVNSCEMGAARKILHVDMDAFFAAIEQRDDKKLRGKPVIVGGNPWGRSVVSTCSYEARKFGVYSGMPCRSAVELCPSGIFLQPRMEYYRKVSNEISSIFMEVTDAIESLSIDEAFLDVTKNCTGNTFATHIARRLQQEILKKVGLSASVGVSYNPFLAKVASSMHKPAGLTVITPEKAETFLETLPIRRFYGIGMVMAARLEARQIFTGADLKAMPLSLLTEMFGKVGRFYYGIVRGHDPRIVQARRLRKSIGRECTFARDLQGVADAEVALHRIAAHIANLLQSNELCGRSLALKVRYDNFQCIMRSRSFQRNFSDFEQIISIARQLLVERTEVATRRIRLLGISVGMLTKCCQNVSNSQKISQLELPLIFDGQCDAQSQVIT